MKDATFVVENHIIEISDKWPTNNQYLHFHNQYEIYYLIKGEVNYFIENEIFHVCQDDVVLLGPGVIHKTSKVHGVERKRLLIFISEYDIQEYLELFPNLLNCFSKHVLHISSAFAPRIKLIFDELIIENNSKSPNFAYIKALFVQLLVLLSRDTVAKESSSDKKDVSKDQILEIAEYLNQHFDEDISLEMLSKKFGFHKNYISRRFLEVLKISYLEYLTNLRIRKAIDYLSAGNLTITQIAEKTGFKSSNTFCAVFKKNFGISPLNYKKMKSNEANCLTTDKK